MKRTVKFAFLACLILIASAFMFTACDNQTEPPHVHTEVIDPAVSPTCTTTGLTEGKHCSVCNKVIIAQNVVDALGHNYIDGICTRCGGRTSQGLKYQLSFYSEDYIVYGIGTCTDADVIIPDTYNGLPVTSIGDDAFRGCSSLTSITIPDSVTSIGDDAFRGCSSLTSVTIGSGVTSIGDDAFYYCTSLTSITVDADNQYYTSIDGNLYTKDGKTLIQYIIGKTASEFTIPDSVTTIGSYAFRGCSSLTSVTIGSGVNTIGDGAFYYCSSLTSITISDSVTTIGYGAFYGCSSLTSITIPEGVTSIGSYAFEYCSSLTSITIPNSVTSIGEYAFDGCSSLINITFEGAVEQWNAIAKESNWNSSTGSYTIYCTDGEITNDGTVTYY